MRSTSPLPAEMRPAFAVAASASAFFSSAWYFLARSLASSRSFCASSMSLPMVTRRCLSASVDRLLAEHVIERQQHAEVDDERDERRPLLVRDVRPVDRRGAVVAAAWLARPCSRLALGGRVRGGVAGRRGRRARRGAAAVLCANARAAVSPRSATTTAARRRRAPKRALAPCVASSDATSRPSTREAMSRPSARASAGAAFARRSASAPIALRPCSSVGRGLGADVVHELCLALEPFGAQGVALGGAGLASLGRGWPRTSRALWPSVRPPSWPRARPLDALFALLEELHHRVEENRLQDEEQDDEEADLDDEG